MKWRRICARRGAGALHCPRIGFKAVNDTYGHEVEATIRKAAASVFEFESQEISVSASVGASSPATARSTAEQLLRESDQRMYADKIAGRAQRAQLAKPQETLKISTTTVKSVIERRKRRARNLLLVGNRS